MKAMVLHKIGKPLLLEDVPTPIPKEDEILLQVDACAVCRTDLHIIDGELKGPKLPLIPGHQIIGRIVEKGSNVSNMNIGARVGIPWLASTCGVCEYCQRTRENLCDNALFTGYLRDGGFAEYAVAKANYAFRMPESGSSTELAPLLCAGLIGYRALKLTDLEFDPKNLRGKNIGFYGFGASAHILIQLVRYLGGKVYAFTREGDSMGQAFAKSLGATWSGGANETPPKLLDSAIIFASTGALYPQALKAVKKGAIVVSADIHMSDIPTFSYDLLWEERVMRSTANLTRKDGMEFLELALKIPIQTQVTTYPLEKLNEALDDLRHGRFKGSAVINISNI